MCNKCRMRMIELAGKPPQIEGLEPELVRVANLIYSGKLKPGQIDKAMVKKIAEQLMNGVFKGYGKTLDAKDLTPAERNFLTNVNKNVHVFSGFKNYQQLKEATLLIKDDDDKLKSFKAFFEDLKQLDVTYNEVYQSAEWGNAVSSSQNAASWNDFINNGVEVLTFQTAEDDRVRPEHAIMNGMTVSIDSPVLNIYFTPLDWGCRCEWIPGEEKNIKDADDYTLPDIPKMFQNNVGKTAVIFPESHPYFDVAKREKNSIINQVNDIISIRDKPEIVEEKSYKVINADADKIIKAQVEILTDEYPNSSLKSFYGTKRTSIAESSLGKFMGFNPKYFNNLDYFEKTIKNYKETGYLHKATSINGIIDHEFGHILTSQALPINVKEDTPFKSDLTKIFNRYRTALNESTKKGVKWIDNPDFVSKYSHTNLREFAAESFSYARSSKDASPYAKEVLNLINKYFK